MTRDSEPNIIRVPRQADTKARVFEPATGPRPVSTPDSEARPEEPRTTTGTWLIAMHPELARLTTGRVVNEANEYVVPVIEAEAAALRESEVRDELRERVAGLRAATVRFLAIDDALPDSCFGTEWEDGPTAEWDAAVAEWRAARDELDRLLSESQS